jgi:subtilisin family serine protease
MSVLRKIWNKTLSYMPKRTDGCLYKLMWPFLLGIAFFAALIALLMSVFRGDNSTEADGFSREPDNGNFSQLPYPYDPADPSEGGKYPNPNHPGRSVVILPPGEGGGSVFPILPIDIIVDPVDSIRQVVSNRLNVLLDRQNENTGKEFMSKFKMLYPDNAYFFNYFDTLTYRLQMTVPPEKRHYLKMNLNNQMPEFDFLLFDEEVFVMSAMPDDPGFEVKQKSWYFEAVRASQAWDITRGDKDVIVAVVDNGFDLNHPELSGKVVLPMNIPERNSHIYPIIDEKGNDHGTHVAATAVGNADNQSGVSGIAPGCSLMPVQVATADGMMFSTCIMDGVLYAIYKGASVINVSLGPQPPEWFCRLTPAQQQKYISSDDQRLSQVWNKIYQIADKHGCTVVTAAGNENILSGYASKARTDSVVVVSAVNESLHKADFSNYGRFPGWKLNYSTVSAPGVEIYNAVNRNRYAYLQGTSMAAPIVSGAVALIRSVNPQLKTMQIIEILQKSGKPLDEPIGPFIQIDKALEMAMEWKSIHWNSNN